MPQPSSWVGTPKIKGSSESIRMALLTASLIGIQFTWGIEMTYCTPYLLELGLTKSKVSLVWIAGPLSGLIMQPVVGIIADRSKSKWGRRRPFMVVGAAIVSLSLLVLGWTAEIVGLFVAADGEVHKASTILLAVLSIYAVDFAINAVQASTRSLIVDTLPIPKQQLGSAWASRMVAVGHLVGYGAGALDLGSIFGTRLGDTQFKQLTVVAATALCLSVGITCFAVTERILISTGDEEEQEQSAWQMMKKLLVTSTNLPPRISAICWVQFWCWIGWFPFLFYSTTWVGEIYLRYSAPVEARTAPDTLGTIGRVGSLSLIVFSLITFLGSIILPWIIKAPSDVSKPDFTPRPPAAIAPLVLEFEKYKPSLLTAWKWSHLLFAGSMILTPWVGSLRSATALVAICGIPWALACWAPFTFMGIEINRLSTSASTSSYHTVAARGSIELEPDGGVLRIHHNPDDAEGSTGELAGVYLGILNLYTTLPQFIGTFISWVVFSVLEPGKSPELAGEGEEGVHGTEGPNGIAVCLFIGAVCSAVAAYATHRLGKVQ
ncbi:MFS general substrate transporter [Aulographum hederae CBS 113979]|uniref:MFS general substrate transporter n=1 Tax=Aulographum hederae CBS 113979 TaxID=1176131 RepID=A0A6G1GYY0_9PEZI|nr:MFS general substrate transporter [Aulographum hederae CBS 113979]